MLTIPAWTTGLRKSFVDSQLRQMAAEELLVLEMSPMEGNQSSKPKEG